MIAKDKEKSSFINIALVFISISISLLFMEILVQHYFKEEHDTVHLQEQQRRVTITPLIQASNISKLIFELKPSMVQKMFDGMIYTDSQGVRVPKEQRENNPTKSIKVAILGDSTAFGWGLNYEEIYPTILQENLRLHHHIDIVIRNFSVPAYNTQQELIYLKQKVLEWNPQILLLHYDHNDSNATATEDAYFMAPEYGDNIVHSKLLKFVIRRFRRWQQLNTIDTHESETVQYSASGLVIGGQAFDEHIYALKEIAQLCDERNILRIALVFDARISQKDKWDSDPHYVELHLPLIKILKKNDFHIIDLYPALQKLMKSNNWLNLKSFWQSVEFNDAHPTAEGHKFIASVLEQTFVDRQIFQSFMSAPGPQ